MMRNMKCFPDNPAFRSALGGVLDARNSILGHAPTNVLSKAQLDGLISAYSAWLELPELVSVASAEAALARIKDLAPDGAEPEEIDELWKTRWAAELQESVSEIAALIDELRLSSQRIEAAVHSESHATRHRPQRRRSHSCFCAQHSQHCSAATCICFAR
eukprot:m.282543 g.282543  ORF g.282543 m.282543 type:complete len:160 (+) comp11113_c0_seq1:666-1145(+)